MQKEQFSDSINPVLNNLVLVNRMLFNRVYTEKTRHRSHLQRYTGLRTLPATGLKTVDRLIKLESSPVAFKYSKERILSKLNNGWFK